MTIFVTAGPSLTAADRKAYNNVTFVPPAAEGDMFRLVRRGATEIGVIDGVFGSQQALGHKEILWAIANGVRVYGAASIGALRAVELGPYGMIGVGEVFRGYSLGVLSDDGDVALLHAPAELDYRPLTLPLVDVRATAASLLARRRLRGLQYQQVLRHAAAIYFQDRTWPVLAARCTSSPVEARRLAEELARAHVERKRLDALELLALMLSDTQLLRGPDRPGSPPLWPPMTPAFRTAMRRAGASLLSSGTADDSAIRHPPPAPLRRAIG